MYKDESGLLVLEMGRRVVLRWTSALDSSQSNRIRSSWIDATNPHFIDILKGYLCTQT